VANIRVGQYPQSLCCNPLGNKVYCANEEWSSIGKISVIDAGADTVLSTILTATSAHDVCYNPARNRVYCGHSVGQVTAIDAGQDTIVKLIPTPSGVTELTYVPMYNKLYFSLPVTGGYYLGVIDCATESLTAVLYCMGEAFVGHPANGKVYFISHDVLKAIDGNGDTLVPPTLEMGTTGIALCWNPTNDKLYWASAGRVSIVDCASDTVVATVAAGAASLFYESSRNRVYCTGWDWVTVLDGATNQVLNTITIGPSAERTAYSLPEERLYVVNRDGSSLSVIRTTPPGIVDDSFGQRDPDHASVATLVRSMRHTGDLAVSVFDAVGRRVFPMETQRRDGCTPAPGVYFLVQGSGVQTRKVVVTR
jgi:DNA-binding beta-propeller fold protein YncE